MGLRYFRFKGKDYGVAPWIARLLPFNPDNCTHTDATDAQNAIEDIDASITTTNRNLSATNGMISDAWKSTTTYTVGSYCIYNNSLWQCKVQNTNQAPTEGTYWTKTSVINNLVNVKSKTYTAKGLTFEFKKVGTTVQVYCSGTSTESGAYTDTFFTVSDEFKPIMLMWGRCAFATDVVFYIDTTGKFSTTGTTLQKGQDIRFSMTYASAC